MSDGAYIRRCVLVSRIMRAFLFKLVEKHAGIEGVYGLEEVCLFVCEHLNIRRIAFNEQ